MNSLFRSVAVAGLLLATASTSQAGLITNGSFENTPALVNGGGTWGLFPSIEGWTATGGNQIEVGRGTIYGVTGFDGQNVLELDSTGNAVVSQIVAVSGGHYTLSFLGARRANVQEPSTTFDVYWNNVRVGSYAPTLTAMSRYSLTVVADSSNTLEFRGTGTSDSYGAILDDVRLSVPDGGATLGLLGAALLGRGALRRKLS